MDRKGIFSGTPEQQGQSGPIYTAAFTQPISTPGEIDSVSEPFGQTLGAVQPAQPMMGQPMPGAPEQPMLGQSASGMPGQPMPGQPMPGMPGMAPQMPNVEQNPLTGQPMIGRASQQIVVEKKDYKALYKTIAIIALSLVSVTFIGLFLWMFTEYTTIKSDEEGRIAKAVGEERDALITKMEEEFAEREKTPFKIFAGPVDYGSLTFEYPKTWSVYIADDALDGSDFEAYLNPGEVNVVADTTIDALRVKILNTPFDTVVKEYQPSLEVGRDGAPPTMRLESTTIGQDNAIVANRYVGLIPGTEFQGCVIVFKLRDKTVVLQTDSMLFENDFNTLLSTIKFNA